MIMDYDINNLFELIGAETIPQASPVNGVSFDFAKNRYDTLIIDFNLRANTKSAPRYLLYNFEDSLGLTWTSEYVAGGVTGGTNYSGGTGFSSGAAAILGRTGWNYSSYYTGNQIIHLNPGPLHIIESSGTFRAEGNLSNHLAGSCGSRVDNATGAIEPEQLKVFMDGTASGTTIHGDIKVVGMKRVLTGF